MTQSPSKYFNMPVIGTITVKNIFSNDKNAITVYEVIEETEIVFICNVWYKEYKKVPQFIPKSLNHWTKNY